MNVTHNAVCAIALVCCTLGGACGDDACRKIDGSLEGGELERCAAKVETIGGDSILTNVPLDVVRFPRLRHVSGSIHASDSAAGVRALEFPVLKDVEGVFHLEKEARLESVTLPSLLAVGSMRILGNPALVRMDVGA